MAVEILTVSLSDESIEGLANAVARLIRNQVLGGNQPAAESNPPSSETHTTRSAQNVSQGADPWRGEANPSDDGGWPQGATRQPPQGQQNQPPPQNNGPQVPRCVHGEMRFVPAGFSKSSGKAYKAFHGCPAPRGQEQCRSVPA